MVVIMKNKKYLFVLLATLVIFCLVFMAACQPPDIPDDTDDEEPDEIVTSDGLLVSNGKFASLGTGNSAQRYLKTSVPGWTSVSGSKTTDTSGIVMGIIDLEINKFAENKTKLISDFNDYPGLGPSTARNEEDTDWADTNALVLGIPSTLEKGSVYFSSPDITIEKDQYYKLNIEIYTDLQKGENDVKSGAAICLTDGVFAEYLSIDTQKTWDTYSFYIKGNGYEDRKFKIQLWLGHGPEKIGEVVNPYLAAGVVLYDNVVLSKIDDVDYDAIATNVEIQQTVYDGDRNATTRLDLSFPDQAMTQYTSYDATSKYAGSTGYYYSAKKGTTPNYNFIVGGNDLTSADRDSFPVYTTTKTDTFPIGVFDMSKLYSFVNDTPTNEYAKIYTSSGGFKAPDYLDFYKKVGDEWQFNLAGSNGTNRAADSSFDTNALMIYHPNYSISGAGYKSKSKLEIEKNTYYKISVWVYIWIPEMTAPAVLTGDDLSDPVKVAAYDEKKAQYDKYLEFYGGDRDVKATFRVTGASVEQNSSLEVQSTGFGSWQQLTLNIKGNELSERQLNLEFWYGEGKWDSDTLYPGACFFDDVSINSYTDDTIVAAGEDPTDYYQLSILQQGDFKYFGLIDNGTVSTSAFTSLENIPNTLWEHEAVDQRTTLSSYSSGILGGLNSFITSNEPSTVEGLGGLMGGPKTITINYNSVATPLDVFMINHVQPTASKATFKIEDADIDVEANLDSLLKVNPNSFYRLSMWVKTQGILKGKGPAVAVYAGESTSAIAQFTGINTDEWIELVLYVQGKAVDSERLNIGVTFGSGDIYTPDSHLQGSFFMTAMTWQKITYEEHKNADTTQTNVKKQTLSESSGGATSSITNGFFTNIETSNYDDAELFDASGNLTGVATPSNWNKTEAKATLAKPVITLNDAHTKITWNPIDKATYYYVFMNKYPIDGSTETEDNVLVSRIAAGTNEYTLQSNGTYYLRAVGGVLLQTNMFSPASSVVTATKLTGSITPVKYAGEGKDLFDTKMGIINYLYYEGFDASDRASLYGDPSQGFYKSTSSNNLLIISSELDTYTGYTMSSSHTVYKNKYYVVSIWVKTIDGAKASITLKNPSSALTLKEYADNNAEVNGEFIGFVNVDTAGQWIQYRMIINSTMADGRVQLELFLGNQYAIDISSGETEDDITYSQGLSRGTVFFDDINIKELTTTEEFNLNAYGVEDPTLVDETEWLVENKTSEPYTLYENSSSTGSLYKNSYIFKIIDFAIDSFDNYTDATDDFTGHAPGAYNHKDASTEAPYLTPTEGVIPPMLYGVYSEKQLTEAVYGYLEETGFALADIQTFLTSGTNGNGRYFLMLANINDNGQYYEQKSGFEAEAGSYYEIKFWAKLLAPEGKNAEFRFIYGNETTKWSTINISGTSLKEYKFYVYNEDTETPISSNKISFHIGTNDGLVGSTDTKNFFKGILVVDDVSITKLPANEDTITAYAALDPKDKYMFAAKVEEETPTEEPEEEEDKKPEVDPQIWLLIASIVIGAMLLVTIVVLIVRRITKKMAKNKKVVIQSKVPASGIVPKKKDEINKGRKELLDSDIDKFTD